MEKINKTYLFRITLIGALGGFLFGFDTAIVSGTISFISEQFSLSAVMTGWYVSSALVGCIFGVLGAGYLSDRFGRKYVLVFCALLFIISALGCFFTSSFSYLITYRIIGGIAIGVASVLSPLYISEISPASVRGRLVALYQFAIAVGILFSYLINAGLLKISQDSMNPVDTFIYRAFHEEVSRVMLGSNVIPAGMFFILLFFVPESPRWLILKGKVQSAMTTITRLSGEEAAKAEIRGIKSVSGNTSKNKNLFSGKNIRLALTIGIALGFLTQFSGINAIIYYGPNILNEAGLKLSEAFGGQVIIGFTNIIFTTIAIWKIDSFGRKPLLIWGVSGILVSLVSISLLFALSVTSSLWLLIGILCFVACYSMSYGPVVWVLLSELYPNAIRGRAMSLGTLAVWVGNAMIGQMVPVMLTSLTAAGTFLVFAILTLPAIPLVLLYVPETKGKTLEEIEKYWMESPKGLKVSQ